MFKENDVYFFFFLSERIVLFLFVCLFLNTVFTFRVCMHLCVLSHYSRVQLLATLWTVAHQAPLSMGFSRQENWSGLSFPPPGEGKCFPFSPSWRWERLSTPVFWPGEFNGLYSPWGCKESDMTERLSLLQRIFLTQGSNPHLLCLLQWQVGSLPQGPPGKPYSVHIFILCIQ